MEGDHLASRLLQPEEINENEIDSFASEGVVFYKLLKMNVLQAKQVSILDYLERKGYKPLSMHGSEVKFIAQYRGERTASLTVSRDGKLFCDFGFDNKGGDVIDLAKLINGYSTTSEALADIESTMGGMYCVSAFTSAPRRPNDSRYHYDVFPLTNSRLINYAASRGIPQDILCLECVEVHFFSNECQSTPLLYIGFPCRSGGYELRNDAKSDFCKITIGQKDISIIGDVSGSTCLVFEGFFDYLSAKTMGWVAPPSYTAIVLNSTSNAMKAIKILQTAREVHLWLDDDDTGKRTAAKLLRILPRAIDLTGQGYLCESNDVNDFVAKRDHPLAGKK